MDWSIVRGIGAGLFRTLKPVAVITGVLFGCYAIYAGSFGNPPAGGPLLWTGIGVFSLLDALWLLFREPPIAD